jgi:predicted site-specific integrase-resolvase
MKTREETTKTEVVQMLNMTRACEIWGVTKWHVYDLIKAGRIKPITNAGKGFKFLVTDYKQEFLERL